MLQDTGWQSTPGAAAVRRQGVRKNFREFAEERTDIVLVLIVGSSFDSLGEAYGYYNLYL